MLGSAKQVCIKRPPEPLAENISSSKPPPKDAEAYFTPRRTIKHFTDEYFAFQEARLESRGDLDEDGKSRVSSTWRKLGRYELIP